MKLAAALPSLPMLLVVAACGSSKPAPTTTTTTTTEQAPTTATTTSSPAPAATPASTVVTTTTTSRPAPKGSKAQHSCFSYVTGNLKTPRHACSRSEDCDTYLEQARAMRGFRELTGCANVATVYCVHMVATKDEPEGQDLCRPTLDECKIARDEVLKAKMSVDSDCTQR